MHDPLLAIHDVKEALALAASERIPPYLRHQRDALEEWFSKPEGPLSDPLVEFDPPFESAALSWGEVVQEGLLLPETLELLQRGGTIKSIKPYQHQLEAIHAARSGKSLVISAGTGSGKTECFLIPILDDLLREASTNRRALQGLRSMLVYPLNALVFDQMGRWRSVLRHQMDVLGYIPIRLSMYNAFLQKKREVGSDLRPTFRALGMDENHPDLRPYLPMEGGEVTTREKFLNGGDSGANLLITNYVMLELALLRDADQRWLSEAKGWKHLVLDEAHTYTGGLAVDIALLLRRLRDRIGPERPPQGFATSATFGGKNARTELAAFTSVLFGQEQTNIEVLQGRRIAVRPDPSVPLDIKADYAALIRFLATKQDAERLKPLTFRLSEVEQLFQRKGETGSTRFKTLLRRCSESPSADGSRALLPHRLHAVLRRPIPWASQCINPQCPGRWELKGYLRWPSLGWVGQDPSDDVCPKCQGPMLLPVTCGYEGCAQEGLLARASYDVFPPALKGLSHPDAETSHLAETGVLLVPRAEWPQDRPATPVLLEGGRVQESHSEESEWIAVPVERDKDENALECPRCKEVGTLKNTWSSQFSAGAMDLVAMDRLLSLQLPDGRTEGEPNAGRRLLSFADSRQGAARLAPRLAFTHRVIFVRRWMVDTLRTIPASTPQLEKCLNQLETLRKSNQGGLMDDIIRQKEAELTSLQCGETIPNLIKQMVQDVSRLKQWARSLEGSRFQQRFHGKDLLPVDVYGKNPDLETIWYGLIRGLTGKSALAAMSRGERGGDDLTRAFIEFLSRELLLAVLRELCRPPGRTPTAIKLGLIQIQWPKLLGPLAPLEALKIPEELHQETFERACTLLLEQRCLELPQGISGREEDWGSAFINRRATLQESATEGEVFSFASDRLDMRRFTAFLDLLAEKCIGRTDDLWNKRAYVALWDSLRIASGDLPLLSMFQDGSVDYLRLKAERLQLRPGNHAFHCTRCGSTSPWGGTGRCSEPRYRTAKGKERSEPCGADLKEIDPSEPQPIEGTAFPHARDMILNRPAPEGLTAFEHTAQRSGDKVRRDELLFRQSRMNVLCSSTTLEMGVDLPDLDTVVLMGVPPAASNHTQRVGRAGRTRKRSCLALTLAGEDSFDRWAHRDLMAFLKRPGITPQVDLDREEKLRQHFFAWRLGLLVRSGDLLRVGSGAELLNRISVFAGIDPETQRNAVAEWNARYPQANWRLDGFAPGWGDEALLQWESLTPQQMARGMAIFGRSVEELLGWLKDGKNHLKEQIDDIRRQVLKIQDAISNGPEQQVKFMRRLLASLREYDALAWLAENHQLPRFGFPISSVSLTPPQDIDNVEPIDRDRRQAVMEWTPGANIVVANRRWIVRGLAPDIRRGRAETHHRLFTLLRCRSCGHLHISRSADLGNCPACSSSERDMMSVAIPYAFASEETSKLAGTEAQIPYGRSSRILTLDDREWPEGLAVFRPSVPVAFLNLGLEEKGYWLCSACGRLRFAKGRWTRCCSRDTQSEPEPVALGEVVRMDVLRIRPSLGVSHEGLRATAQALRLAAAFLLELDPRSLALADILEDGLNTIYLIDLTDGGSGLLARLHQERRCREWMNLALSILTHEKAPEKACANACPECLLTHDNRTEHRKKPFRRSHGIEAIKALLCELDGEGTLEGGDEEDKTISASATPWTWQDAAALTVLNPEIMDHLQARALPVPEVGRDLMLGCETVGVAELCWPDLKVALLDVEEPIPEIPGWEYVRTSDADMLTKLQEIITERTALLSKQNETSPFRQ